MEKEEYTLKEAAKLLNLSTQTVKRRIDRGEIQARKEVTDFGERWLIPSHQLIKQEPVPNVETLPTQRQISISELQKAFSMVAAAQTAEIKQHISLLEGKIDRQNEILEVQGAMLDGHYRLVDQRLRELQEKGQKKSFWRRIF